MVVHLYIGRNGQFATVAVLFLQKPLAQEHLSIYYRSHQHNPWDTPNIQVYYLEEHAGVEEREVERSRFHHGNDGFSNRDYGMAR